MLLAIPGVAEMTSRSEPARGAGKPTLLYVSIHFPYPATGGGELRMSNLLRRSLKPTRLHYLSLGQTEQEPSPAALAQAEPFCELITVVPHTRSRVRAALKIFLTLSPYEINLFDNPEFAEAVRRLTEPYGPTCCGSAARRRPLPGRQGGALAVLDQHDLTSQLWRLMRAGAPEAWVRLFAGGQRLPGRTVRATGSIPGSTSRYRYRKRSGA